MKEDLNAMIETLELTNAQSDELKREFSEFIGKLPIFYHEFQVHSFIRLFSGKDPYYLEMFVVGDGTDISIEWFKPYFSENEYFKAMELVKNK